MALALCCAHLQGQNVEGQIIASEFGQFIVPATTTGSFQFPPASCQVSGGGKNFAAFTAGVPVKIVDASPSLIEIDTPSSVYINTCVINMATSYTHVPPFYLTSGTGGLQEAIINGPTKQGGANTVILNADWYTQVQPGNPATVIASVHGNSTIGLVDITKTPYNWYQWNGTQYVLVTIGGGLVNSVTATLPLQSSGGANPNISCPSGCTPAYGWVNGLASTQLSTDTLITLQNSVTGYPALNTFYIGNEWETCTAVNTGTNQLTGCARGVSLTTPASHSLVGDTVLSVDVPFGNGTQFPAGGVFGAPTSSIIPQILGVNCGTPAPYNDSGALTAFQVNCGSSATWIDTAGRIHQAALNNIFNFFSPFYVGNLANDTVDNIGQPLPVTNSTLLAQTNGQYQFAQPIGMSNGIVGDVIARPISNIPAPTLNGLTGGSCSITYELVGTDADGETIPGATATATGLDFPGPGIVDIQAPLAAGMVSMDVYRTAVSACGSIVIGRFTTTATTQFPLFQDTGQTGDGTSPPGSNTSIAKSCVNGKAYCMLAGSGPTPPMACGSGTWGWDYKNVSATASPSEYHCYSGASSWTAGPY